MKRDQFYNLLNGMGLSGRGVEVGVCEAKFSRQWIPQTKFKQYWLVDLWRHFDTGYVDSANVDQARQDLRHLEVAKYAFGLSGKDVRILREDSVAAASVFPDLYFDFVYIDANHGYDNVKADIGAWYPKTAAGGVFAGHDYGTANFPGVRKAVDEWVAESGNKLELCLESSASWFVVNKLEQPTIIY